MDKICCIVLAAGAGKRMGGDLPKAIVQTREKALIDHLLEALKPLKPSSTIVVVGHRQELLRKHLSQTPSGAGHSITIVTQEEQLGTGHAVRCALPALTDFKGTVLITYADHPLFTGETLSLFAAYHAFKKATVTMLSFKTPPPHSYGRIIRDASGCVLRITEARDCSPEEALVTEANSGFYAVDSSFLKPAVESLTNNNAQGEYYLTDIVQKASKEGQTVAAFALPDATEAAGVNSPRDLALVNEVLMRRQIEKLQGEGVVFVDPKSCFLDSSVSIGRGASIGPNVQLRGSSTIGEGVIIEGTAIIKDSSIASNAAIKLGCHIEGAVVGRETSVGPFANVRPGTNLGAHVRVGNFVETKNATLHDGAKASHLSYLGDCSVGKDTNIGAGTITCNYDGYQKASTTIGEKVFIGSNSALVAPVTIGDGALIAAGSVVTRDVPPEALGIARAKQENKEGWERERRKALESSKPRSS